MNKDTLRQSANVIALLATVVVNALANILPLNGKTTGEISDQFKVYFVPAGYVFIIWGVIYLALVAFAFYQARPAQKENPRLRRMGYFFVWSCLANLIWLFLWHYELFGLTVVAMLALLLSLVMVYLRLEVGRRQVSMAETLLLNVPFSIYLGWVSVATIANVTSLLDYLKWGGWGLAAEVWFIIMMVAAVVIGAAMAITRNDVAYLLVFLWAFAGIAVKQADSAVVANTAWMAFVVIALLLVVGIVNRRRLRQQGLFAGV
ncbi:MAG: tryptophan-rich sensory protein [Anaerolineales bacterium]|nr:MAG: tryptophan-rich sensory protein [Anaerolineales bacterium]